MPDVAAKIAEYAREKLDGVEVVSVGSVFAREIQGVMCHMVVALVPDRVRSPRRLPRSRSISAQ
jgi:hypothetical protein